MRVGLWRKLSTKRCFWTVVLEKTLESPLDCKEIQPVHPKGGQSWVFTGRTDVEAETLILWPRDVKNWLIWKDPDTGKDWGQEEKGMTEDEMVGWHHQLDGHGFGWTLEVGDGQGSLLYFSSWCCKELDTTEQQNWTEQICRWHTLMAESEEELKSLLKKVKEESEKAGLKFNIQKQKIMALGPIASWQIDGETM